MRTAYQNIKGAAAVAWDRKDFLVKGGKKKLKGKKRENIYIYIYIGIIYTYLNNIEKSPYGRTHGKNFCCPFVKTKTTRASVKFW